MNYTEMNKVEKEQMQKLMLHHYTNMGIAEGLDDWDIRDHIQFELELFEADERYEECALLRDVLKKWDNMNG
jgi:hypothetical protein